MDSDDLKKQLESNNEIVYPKSDYDKRECAAADMIEIAENYHKSKVEKLHIQNVRLALIAFEESKHKFLSEKYRHEYAVKVVDEYLGNL